MWEMLVKTSLILGVLGVAAILAGAPSAQAAGCIKGAVVGGVAGHAAGHGVLGAAGGCAVGRHVANRNAAKSQDAQRQPQQPGSR